MGYPTHNSNEVINVLVKCKICGQKIDRNDAFKIRKNNKNEYYCNQQEYKDWFEIKNNKDRCFEIIYSIFGHKVTNTILYKEMNELFEIYGINLILSYLNENFNFLNDMLSKSFNSEYAQIRYFSAILKNNLYDYKLKNKDVPIVTKIDMPSKNKYKEQKRKKSLLEYEHEIGDEL